MSWVALVAVKRREFRLELAESRRILPKGQLTGAPSAVKAGLIRFYRDVTTPLISDGKKLRPPSIAKALLRKTTEHGGHACDVAARVVEIGN
jgi:hypothetical protein